MLLHFSTIGVSVHTEQPSVSIEGVGVNVELCHGHNGGAGDNLLHRSVGRLHDDEQRRILRDLLPRIHDLERLLGGDNPRDAVFLLL